MVSPRISLPIFTIPGFHWFSLLGFSQQSWFSSVQSFSHVQLITTPWTAAHQASLSIINSQSLLKLMFIESVMPSNHLIPCHPLLFLPSIFPNIMVFSNESVLCIRWSKYWSFSFSISPTVIGRIGKRSPKWRWLQDKEGPRTTVKTSGRTNRTNSTPG